MSATVALLVVKGNFVVYFDAGHRLVPRNRIRGTPAASRRPRASRMALMASAAVGAKADAEAADVS
jgi:hypothetical protein